MSWKIYFLPNNRHLSGHRHYILHYYSKICHYLLAQVSSKLHSIELRIMRKKILTECLKQNTSFDFLVYYLKFIQFLYWQSKGTGEIINLSPSVGTLPPQFVHLRSLISKCNISKNKKLRKSQKCGYQCSIIVREECDRSDEKWYCRMKIHITLTFFNGAYHWKWESGDVKR